MVAWFLREALLEAGHDVELQRDHDNPGSVVDHTLMISNVGMTKYRGSSGYRRLVRETTRGKVTLWLDVDIEGWDAIFDRVFTTTAPRAARGPKYIHAGWAADPGHCYPDKDGKEIFIDPYMWGWYGGEYDGIYENYRAILEALGYKVHQPVKTYNKGRITWLELQAIFRRAQFSLVTQVGMWGLTNIEAAMAGCLLVIPQAINRPNTWPSQLQHVTWRNKQQLIYILQGPTNVEAICAAAAPNTWDKAAARVLEGLQ